MNRYKNSTIHLFVWRLTSDMSRCFTVKRFALRIRLLISFCISTNISSILNVKWNDKCIEHIISSCKFMDDQYIKWKDFRHHKKLRTRKLLNCKKSFKWTFNIPMIKLMENVNFKWLDDVSKCPQITGTYLMLRL